MASDGWTALAVDGMPSAHFEHTLLVDDGTQPHLPRRFENAEEFLSIDKGGSLIFYRVKNLPIVFLRCEWIPDPKSAEILHDMEPSAGPGQQPEILALWAAARKEGDPPDYQPYLKTILCRIVSLYLREST